ncbi:MAG: DUF1513 domain-containing protein [Comamonadaceae bacterium]|nr:MAG: DUF1513 domain-containing protein [Comamonadaceae bacterium]
MHAPVRHAAVNRRDALCWLGGLLTAPMAVSHAYAKAPASDDLRLAAAWQQADGSYRIGVLAAGRSASGAPLRVIDSMEVPTRAHGVHALPDGSIVATARRPGDWLVRWHPGRAAPATWHWVDATRSFNGHVIGRPDGRALYTTETDIDTGASLIARRDARSLQTEAEWPTHGIDAHELIWAPAAAGGKGTGRTLIVANGGVPTAPETGRVKRDLHTHLAWNADRTVLGIALQAEHDEAAIKHSAPILALFDGQALRVMSAPQAVASSIHGYGGSIAATPMGWAVSCPRADGIATFAPQGDWLRLVALPDVCALAVDRQQLWAAGVNHSLQDAMQVAPASPLRHAHAKELDGARMDNHWTIASDGADR